MSAKKIGENQWLVDVDSRGRVSLGKIVGDQELFRVSEYKGKIYLEPVTAYTDAEIDQLQKANLSPEEEQRYDALSDEFERKYADE